MNRDSARPDTPKDRQGMDTPCQNLCHLNPVTGFCDGCGRTGSEIASWGRFTPTERRAIMAILPARLARATVPGSQSKTG
jgi:uncharacterized protein